LNNYGLVLFDFDGTFADTARDMINALNRLRQIHGKPPLLFDDLQGHVSDGTPALIRIGFGFSPGDDEYEAYRQQFLQIYKSNLCGFTDIYPGIGDLLERFRLEKTAWGIVTNKPEGLTIEIMEKLGLLKDACVIIGGDSLPQRKPHPLPILHACDVAGVDPRCAVFIGDSVRDILAGQRAGTDTIAVTYGYIPPGDDPSQWKADHVVDTVDEITDILWSTPFQRESG